MVGGRKAELRRRTFLSALGLGLATPFASKLAALAGASPTGRPVRLVLMYIPNGWPQEHVDPGANGSGLYSAETNVLMPLMPYRDSVTFVSGIGMNDGAHNHEAIPAVMTGFSGGGSGDSVDRVIADALGVKAHVIGTVPYPNYESFSSNSYLAFHNNTVVEPQWDPTKAAEDLLGAVSAQPQPEDGSQPDGGADPSLEAAFREEALALTERQLEALQRSVADLSTENEKIRIHLEAVQNIKSGGGGGIMTTCDSAPMLPAVDAMAGLDALDPANFGKALDANLEVMAAALTCGSAQVMTLQNMYAVSDYSFDFAGGPGLAKNFHGTLSHANMSSPADRLDFAAAQRWFYQRIAEKLVGPLAQTPDPLDSGRMMLDNTLIYISSEIGDGDRHNSTPIDGYHEIGGVHYPSPLPALLIGGGAGCIRTGEYINVLGRNNLEMLATLAHVMGVPNASIGGQTPNTIAEVLA